MEMLVFGEEETITKKEKFANCKNNLTNQG